MSETAPLDALVRSLARLPGVGKRSAERMAAALLRDGDGLGSDLLRTLGAARATLTGCTRCGALTLRERDPCTLCRSPQRNGRLLCVVEDPSDIVLLERAGGYQGRYHALMGRLSPAKGVGPQQLRVQALVERIAAEGIEEVILALSTDVEGEATASYVREHLRASGVRLSRLAFGLPAGSGIAYADAVTLARAMEGRHPA